MEHAINPLPPRMVWINGPYSVGKTTLAIFLRDRWGAVVFDADAVIAILEGFKRAGTDVVHVVLGADEAVLCARIHARPLNDLAKRWCLEHLRPAETGLRQIGGAVRIDTSHQPPDQLAGVLAGALERHGWLTETGTWTGYRAAP